MEFNPSAVQSRTVSTDIKRTENTWKSKISPKAINNTNDTPSQTQVSAFKKYSLSSSEEKIVRKSAIIPKAIKRNDSFQPLKLINKYDEGTYEGSYIGVMRHGYGKFFFNDGSVYEGQFQDDKITGVGILSHQGLLYKGDFVDGVIVVGEVYSGNLLLYKGTFGENPQGTRYYSNGTIYEGEFTAETSLPSGKGKLTFECGKTFEGVFKDGFPIEGQVNDKRDILFGKYEYITRDAQGIIGPDAHIPWISIGFRSGGYTMGNLSLFSNKRAAEEELKTEASTTKIPKYI